MIAEFTSLYGEMTDILLKWFPVVCLSLAMFTMLILSVCAMRKLVWRKCRHCCWWYSSEGDYSLEPRAERIEWGKCPACKQRKMK